MTGNQQIQMLRDWSDNTYKFYRGGNFDPEHELTFNKEQHFQPLFFARNVEDLRNNIQAQKQLRKFRIFVKPEEIEAAIAEAEAEARKPKEIDVNVSQFLY